MTTLLHLIRNVGDTFSGFKLAAPVIAHVASSRAQYWGVDDTLGGVQCGHCLDERGETIYHATVAHIRVCDYVRQSDAASALDESWAEGSYDRWAEGGWDVIGAYSYEPYDH